MSKEDDKEEIINDLLEKLRDQAEIVAAITVFDIDEDGAKIIAGIKGDTDSLSTAIAMVLADLIKSLDGKNKRAGMLLKFFAELKDELEERGVTFEKDDLDVRSSGKSDLFDDDDDDEDKPWLNKDDEEDDDVEAVDIKEQINELEKQMNSGDKDE